jgi:uncharacterized protein (UPF0147 family)
MEQIEQMVDIIAVLSDMGQDQNVPKNVRSQMQHLVGILQSQKEHSVKVHDAMNTLDVASNDINLDSYTRTQIFSIVSMLEKMQ